MKPIKTDSTDIVYRGPTPDIGDLWCERVAAGHIRSFWKPSKEELALLVEGGCIELDLHTEPIPPISVNVSAKTQVADHPFKIEEAQPKPGPKQPPDEPKPRRHG